MLLNTARAGYSSAKYLDLTKRIRAQDQIVLDLGLELIPHPFLQQFENVWPVRDMIGQFLRYTNAPNKHRPVHPDVMQS